MEGPAAVQLMRRLTILVVAFALLASSTAHAGRCVGVFFRGFNAPVGTSGMDNLEAHLSAAFGGIPARPFSTQVFNWTQQSQAWTFIDSLSDVDCVVLAGHSFGANSAIEFTEDYLEPASITVDRLFLFDSVGASDDTLPSGVVQGLNYHQVSTVFWEPEGESNVVGATNVYVEGDYGVSNSDITHTEIDCPLFERTPTQYAALFGSQPDLYARVEDHVASLFVLPPVPALGIPGLIGLVAWLVTFGLVALRQGGGRGPRMRPSN